MLYLVTACTASGATVVVASIGSWCKLEWELSIQETGKSAQQCRR